MPISASMVLLNSGIVSLSMTGPEKDADETAE
jgi:hypothetical protein